MNLSRVIVVAVTFLFAQMSSAAVLTGDSIIFDGSSVNVGAGIDDSFGVFSFDFDSGTESDLFVWTSSSSGFLGGTPFVPDMLDIDFDDGSTLVDFSLVSTLLSDLSYSITADSITFSHTSTGFIGPGIVLSGRFITTSSVVPEPSIIALFSLGLVGIGIARRRQS